MTILASLRPDHRLLDQANKIQSLRSVSIALRDDQSKSSSLKSIATAVGKVLKAVAQVRYAFTARVRPIDWVIAIDGKRGGPAEGETPHAFLTRAFRTNREVALPEIIGMSPDQRFVIIDMNRLFGKTRETYGTLAFLCGLAGPLGLWRLVAQMLIGLVATRRPSTAFVYGSLEMVRYRNALIRRGMLLSTSSTWLVEGLRCGLLAARNDVEVIEVLHGASVTSIAPYFEWVHSQAMAKPVYVNLIADLPRFAPQDSHLLTDAEGEIACNTRLWQHRTDKTVSIPRDRFEAPAIVFIGGGSWDADYAATSFFRKELDIIRALRESLQNAEIRYCVHPMHGQSLQKRLFSCVEMAGAVPATLSSPDEILAGRIVVGGFSTSLFEAALLGRQTFAYEDMSTMFIEEVALLVTYNDDINALIGQIADGFRQVSPKSSQDDFKTVSEHAQKRYGLTVKLV
ncbi:hypothetical protein A8B78_01820 [Jannaschia sp. EhC01]|nr:hypothetical protein A8B78_01820 [Jannaschia sp. EhC01]